MPVHYLPVLKIDDHSTESKNYLVVKDTRTRSYRMEPKTSSERERTAAAAAEDKGTGTKGIERGEQNVGQTQDHMTRKELRKAGRS